MLSKQFKCITVVLALGMVSATQAQTAMENMNHEGMNHGTAPVMDHAAMGHGAMPGTEAPVTDGGSMDHGSMQGGPAPSDARDPHAYSGGQDFGPIPRPHLADEHLFGSLLVDRLEWVRTHDNTSTEYDLQAWYGRDYDRAVLKAEGDHDGGKLQKARTELLWSHALTAYWNTQLGVRHDSGIHPDRNWLAFGIQGLSPYWFEVDATAYVWHDGAWRGRQFGRIERPHDAARRLYVRLDLRNLGQFLLQGWQRGRGQIHVRTPRVNVRAVMRELRR